jgi:crotonobetainyl-CoA:carnitine CoA-transferase CaiB-like acyl-CoA transferase
MGCTTIEKHGGNPARNVPPFYHDTSDPEKSLYWFAFNTDKRSISLNLEDSPGQGLFRQLVTRADFVLESFSPGYLDGLGLGYTALSQVNPRIILTSITHFGQKGPHSHYKSCELVDSAMSGLLDITGYPDRPPVREALGSVYFRGSTAAALGTLISHYYREITGKGQQVDISLQEVDITRSAINLVVWQFDKRLLKRSGSRGQFGYALTKGTWPCKDGYVRWSLAGGHLGAPANRALSRWMDDGGMENPLKLVTNWEGLDMAAISRETIDVFETAITKFFLKHTKKEIAEEGLKRGINATIVSNSDDVLHNLHLKARNYWVKLDHPELGISAAYPRYFFLCSETENYAKRHAPSIGQDNDEIYGKEQGLSSKEIATLKEADVI